MKHQNIWHLSKFIIIFVLTLYLSGCASFGPTKPNPPYAGNANPAVLNELAQTNPLFVEELGKLPEIQDGISEKEMSALNDIVELYISDQENLDNSFNEMYKIGLPEYRKCCSPLQALFWLAEDNELHNHKYLIEHYTLNKLLKVAWDTDPLSRRLLSDRQIREVIDGIENENIKEMYLNDLNNGNNYYQLQSSFAADYRRSQRRQINIFSKHSEKMIEENLLKLDNQPRWDDFNTVVERLNAPRLLDYYINENIKYKPTRGYNQAPIHTFSGKWGACDDLTIFGVYILRKAGYDAFDRAVHWTSDNRGHAGTVIKQEDGRYLLAVDFNNRGNSISGPFKDISEVDKKLSGGHQIHYFGPLPNP